MQVGEERVQGGGDNFVIFRKKLKFEVEVELSWADRLVIREFPEMELSWADRLVIGESLKWSCSGQIA